MDRAPVWDEPAHLAAGVSHWVHGRFDLFRANPPLARMVATGPLVATGAIDDSWLAYCDKPGVRAEFDMGNFFLERYGARAFWLTTLARWGAIPLSLVGGIVCYLWASELYGKLAGLVSLSLWCFSPNILTHAAHLTPDLAAASLGIAASYLFRQWLVRPSADSAWLAGTGMGLALLTKHTWLLLFGLWPLLWILNLFTARGLRQGRKAIQLALILLLGLFILNLGYAFSGTGQRLGEYQFVSQSLAGPLAERDGRAGNRFQGSWLGEVPVPLPKDYVIGVDIVKEAFEMRRIAYLAGEFKSGGWWYYYLYAMAVKVPLGTWVLLVLSFGTLCCSRQQGTAADYIVLLAVPATILVVSAVNPGINRHMRYVLPVFPFLFIGASAWARAIATGHRSVAGLGGAAFLWSITSSMLVYPHSTAYFNELAGGPKNGHAHLICSNIDWGQDLLNLKDWLERHPEAKPLTLAYYGPAMPQTAGIDFATLPPQLSDEGASDPRNVGPMPGWHAVSVHILRGSPSRVWNERRQRESLPFGCYQYFLNFEPVARIGYSINVYNLDTGEVNELRRQLGLELVAGVRPIAESRR